jgi:putative ABC transport system permease protein
MVTGAALALAGGKVMRAMLFETSPHEPAVLAAACAMLLAAAALACVLPGLRAARTDPMIALRAE